MKEPFPDLSPELAEQLQRADEFAEDANLMRAFQAAAGDGELWERAERDSQSVLEEFGVEVPKGLDVHFLPDPLAYPGPDYEFFTIRLTRCRTVWVRKQPGPGFEQVQFCLGIEIVPHSPGPIG